MKEKQILCCAECGNQLSHSVKTIKYDEKNYHGIEFTDQTPMSSKGIAIKSIIPMQHNPDPKGKKPYLEFTPQYWMRLDDILPSVKKVKNDRVWQGCCGPSGDYGPNRKCKCGAKIGSERNDCWTPQVFIPDPRTTKWQIVKS